MALRPRFFTDDGREVRFVAAEFPGDEEFALAGARRVAAKATFALDEQQFVADLHSGRYWCFRIEVDGEGMGGVVVEVVKRRYSDDEILSVLLIWGACVRLWLRPALQAAARMRDDLGCSRVRLQSDRWGWVKLLPEGRLSWELEF